MQLSAEPEILNEVLLLHNNDIAFVFVRPDKLKGGAVSTGPGVREKGPAAFISLDLLQQLRQGKSFWFCFKQN